MANSAATPAIGALTLSLCTEGIQPALPDEPFAILDQPGMADQSVLFFAPKWSAKKLTFWHGTTTDLAAVDLITKARALRRQRLDVSDGQTIFKKAVILMITGTWRDAGQVLGPGLTGCRYEVELTAFILPAAS